MQIKISQPIENKILSRIYGRGRGWAFSKVDFVAEFSEGSINQALSSLVKTRKIRRVLRGIYDYPRYSKFLEKDISPDFDQVAHALARKFKWRIQPTGNAALNQLGLSTQVPGSWVYLSDGPDRVYAIEKDTLEFKNATTKNIGFHTRESGLVVQALTALGKNNINPQIISDIRSQIPSGKRAKILKETRSATAWVYDAIKEICKG